MRRFSDVVIKVNRMIKVDKVGKSWCICQMWSKLVCDVLCCEVDFGDSCAKENLKVLCSGEK